LAAKTPHSFDSIKNGGLFFSSLDVSITSIRNLWGFAPQIGLTALISDEAVFLYNTNRPHLSLNYETPEKRNHSRVV
jgi:transposase InsO family protein